MNILNLSGMTVINPITSLGNIRVVRNIEKFHSDLKVLLETEKGTMIYNPDFGSNLYRYLFLPANSSTASLIREEIRTCIESNFDNIIVQSIDIIFTDKTCNAQITYAATSDESGETIVLSFIRGRSIERRCLFYGDKVAL